MPSTCRSSTVRLVLLSCILVALAPAGAVAAPKPVGPFDALVGWWIGKGRLGFTNGKTEEVKCRATYVLADKANNVRQVVRCASPSGKVEVESAISAQGGRLSGNWRERTYDFNGALDGKLLPSGFRVAVTGDDVKANMTVLVRGDRHVVEIQFSESSLVGLTMIFTRR